MGAKRKSDWPKGLYEQDNRFIFRRTHKKKPVYKKLPDDFYQARLEAGKINAQLEGGVYVPPAAVEGHNINMLLTAFRSSKKYKDSTAERYRSAQEHLINYATVNNLLNLHCWTVEAAEAYYHHRAELAAQGTLKVEIGHIKSIFDFAVDRGYITPPNPFRHIKIKRKTSKEKATAHHIVWIEDWPKLITAGHEVDIGEVNYTYGDLIEFTLNTGLRDSELRILEWGDWDKKQDCIRIRAKRTKDGVKFEPKGTQGDVELNDYARGILERIEKTKKSNFMFPHSDGKISRIKYLRLLQRLCKKNDFDSKTRWHDLRHSFASNLRRQGVPLETIMGLMRHASITETLVYAEYHREEGKKAVNQFKY